MLLSGKNALVTGASVGIGAAIADSLESKGANVIRTSKRIEKKEGKTNLRVDLTATSEINRLVHFIKTRYGRLDILVYAAGVWHTDSKVLAGMPLETFSEEEIRTTMEVGLISPMLLINKLLAVIPKGGRIVGISGTFENGVKGWIPYFVSKQGFERFLVGLSEELTPKGIFVNCVSPSDTLTEPYKKFFPQYAIAETCVTPEEVAGAVLTYLEPSSSASGEIRVVKKS